MSVEVNGAGGGERGRYGWMNWAANIAIRENSLKDNTLKVAEKRLAAWRNEDDIIVIDLNRNLNWS